MKDLDLITLFTGILDSAIENEGLDVPVLHLSQPTQQSRDEDGEGVYFQTLFTRRYGWAEKKDVYSSSLNNFTHTETQQYLTTFQVSVFYPRDPSNADRLTAHDLAEILCMRMSTDSSINKFIAAGAGLFRITEVRSEVFDNDQDEQEISPSFDITIVHNRDVTETVDPVESFDANIHAILTSIGS